MTDIIFGSILNGSSVTAAGFIVATLCSLAIGCFIAYMYTLKNSYSKSFIITLALLPAIVQVIIMMVNGNLGAGVAVAGAFSLVRFRSAPGSAKEITSIFLAMAVGLATGMGYIGIAAIFAILITVANLILSSVSFKGFVSEEKTLKVTVPESLDFEGIFDDILIKYTNKAELEEVKTSGMGSLYKLTYKIAMRQNASVKRMIDEIRQRNGNLEITCSRPVMVKAEEL